MSLCAGCAVDRDWDRTRVGGKKRKAAKRREGGYLECVVNGRVERGPEV